MPAIQTDARQVASTVPAATRRRGNSVFRELVAHLREHRTRLRMEWAQRIIEARLLTAMNRKEVAAEVASIYDNYVKALQTGTFEVLQAYAQDLSERIIPRGVQTHEVVGIVLLLRDVLARSLFAKYQADPARLDRVLNAYEPAANRIATTVAVSFVEERERIIRHQRETEEVLRRLNEALEEEAKRIALALHDEAGQMLAAVHLAVAEIAHDLPAPAADRLDKVQHLLKEVESQLRRLSHELRAPMLDTHGLMPALEFLAKGVHQRTGLRISVGGSTGGRVPPLVETAIYRSVQEALNNVARHAQATKVKVDIRRNNNTVRCVVTDDGVGFDVETVTGRNGRRGLGLLGIRERVHVLGGQAEILSAPGRGTKLTMALPVGIS